MDNHFKYIVLKKDGDTWWTTKVEGEDYSNLEVVHETNSTVVAIALCETGKNEG